MASDPTVDATAITYAVLAVALGTGPRTDDLTVATLAQDVADLPHWVRRLCGSKRMEAAAMLTVAAFRR